MMVMTAKVDMKKTAVILGAIAAAILAVILLFGGGDAQTTSATVSDNTARVKFLKDAGWEVANTPTESGQAITIANGVIDAHTTKLWVEPFGCKPTIRDSKSSIKAKTAPRNMQEYTLPIESPEKVITIKW